MPQKIGDEWAEEVWHLRATYDYYKNYAATMSPAFKPISDFKAAGEANAATPEGKRYDAEFRQKYAKIIQVCFQYADPTDGKADVYVNIGKEGKMDNIVSVGQNPSGACLYQLGHKMLSPPSHAPFWIKLTFDPEKLQAK